ncbi:alcohol dehydrogenase catalytic domain-containing protein [Sulfitobacter sp. NFXS29]|uniref:alcohol dehydrogenase catalytic domain-containing protein n=1 Tax=Sulfitobacter sp. NFXS29 TaxID=2818438 RepID=UPI0032DF970B
MTMTGPKPLAQSGAPNTEIGQDNLHWPYQGETLDELLAARPKVSPVPAPDPDEVVVRVEAASICSSDIKVIRMGERHPLFVATGTPPAKTVLGHEVCLRVVAAGTEMSALYPEGLRLGLQPAMKIDGKRAIIGMDLPGGFAQYIVLDGRALGPAAPYVFEVPESLTAAEIALLEPYGCVERAWCPNVRQGLDPTGTALIVAGLNAGDFHASRPLDWAGGVTCVGAVPEGLLAAPAPPSVALGELGETSFDDIIALGDLDADTLTDLAARLATGGMLLQARHTASEGVSRVDPARVHYDSLAFTGTNQTDVLTALAPARQRFDLRKGGTAVVYGAGGAMGRIHVHRLLQMHDGPKVVIATSRKGKRLDDLRADFVPLAQANHRTLIVVEDGALETAAAEHAPDGFDDITVVAPLAQAVERAAGLLAPDGLLSVFAGMPYGETIAFDLASIATGGLRLTGSTGCTTGDMQDVLLRVTTGELSLLDNLKATVGLRALPEALRAVTEGAVSGKIVVYPHAPDRPLVPLTGPLTLSDEAPLRG